ncbi:MAG: acetyl-CoA C-acyltransferase [Legionellales bacterium]|mgnify:CR=1 FL=1|nr:acetyl-CoA C-acyltransferase [Legionellales bacterium]|tara:strand:+ start:5291 stop:6472 length:1182 start_codon:yes stop_codon:yes gene_type:complete
MDDAIVIVGYTRTPMGGLQGALSPLTATELGTAAICGAITKAELDPNDIDEVIMGCVLPAGQGQAPARQAALAAELPVSTGCTTINKMCGSGMKAVMLAHDLLLAGDNKVMLAGGFESMSNAPYLLDKARGGYRLGHGQLYDHMFLDGLEDAYDKGQLMGAFAEQCADKYNFSRETQDNFAITSLERAQKAIENGSFNDEITPVTVKTRKDTITVDTDEGPLNAKPEKIPQLKPAFKKDGTVTAANSSSISDGAAALVLMRESEAKQRGLTPIAKIIAHATQSQEPQWFTTAPVGAIKQVLAKSDWSIADVDLFEINEAFAVVTLAAMAELNLPHNKVNIHGGACALGHPIGASGARIIVTLLNALRQYKMRRGVAALCIGGGEATAMTVELL